MCKKSPLNHLVKSPNDLHFDRLATVWDEAIPLGNGMIGVLIWERKANLDSHWTGLIYGILDLWKIKKNQNGNTVGCIINGK